MPSYFSDTQNWNISQKPWLLIVLGVIYGAIYYFLFRFVITKWNLKTPGREDDESPEADESVLTTSERVTREPRENPAKNEK